MDLTELTVVDIQIDPVTNMPLIVLESRAYGVVFPFWLGIFEANAVALERDGIKTPRPMTHDLMKGAIRAMGGTVRSVVFSELKDDTYYATITIDRGDDTIEVDSRPSDAVSLALRCGAPILIPVELLMRITTYVSVERMLEEFQRPDRKE